MGWNCSAHLHFAMGWNCSAHVSFCYGLELLRPCFISQRAGIDPPQVIEFSCFCQGQTGEESQERQTPERIRRKFRDCPRPLSAVDATAPRCRESFTACASSPGCCSPPPLARWMHVARLRIGLCGCLPFTNARRHLLPVPLATVGRRYLKFTIPDASPCPTEGRLHL